MPLRFRIAMRRLTIGLGFAALALIGNAIGSAIWEGLRHVGD